MKEKFLNFRKDAAMVREREREMAPSKRFNHAGKTILVGPPSKHEVTAAVAKLECRNDLAGFRRSTSLGFTLFTAQSAHWRAVAAADLLLTAF